MPGWGPNAIVIGLGVVLMLVRGVVMAERTDREAQKWEAKVWYDLADERLQARGYEPETIEFKSGFKWGRLYATWRHPALGQREFRMDRLTGRSEEEILAFIEAKR